MNGGPATEKYIHLYGCAAPFLPKLGRTLLPRKQIEHDEAACAFGRPALVLAAPHSFLPLQRAHPHIDRQTPGERRRSQA